MGSPNRPTTRSSVRRPTTRHQASSPRTGVPPTPAKSSSTSAPRVPSATAAQSQTRTRSTAAKGTADPASPAGKVVNTQARSEETVPPTRASAQERDSVPAESPASPKPSTPVASAKPSSVNPPSREGEPSKATGPSPKGAMPADTEGVIEVVAEGGATPRPTRQPNVGPSPSSRPITSRPSAPAARTSSGRDASANPYEDYGRRNQQILADARKRRKEELRREAARAEAEKAAAEKANAQPVEKVIDPYASTGRVTRSGSGAAAADASVGVRPSGTALVDPYAVASAPAPAAPSHDTPPRAPKPTANWRSMGEFYPAN